MKVKVYETTNPQLDWLVAVCKHEATRHKYGAPTFDPKTKRIYETEGLRQIGVNFAPTTDWSQGGPIFSEAGIGAAKAENDCDWVAMRRYTLQCDDAYWCGPTELIAKARCFVASRLGEEVDVPEELK